jgi:hypothetical protein
MTKGFVKAIVYYVVCLGLALLTYSITDYNYAHAPGPHHLIIFFTFVVGFLWLGVALVRYLSKENRTKESKALILTHLFMCSAFALYIVIITRVPEMAENESKVRVVESGDTTTMYHGGTPVYYKIKDKVLYNFIDSTQVDWDKVEIVKNE